MLCDTSSALIKYRSVNRGKCVDVIVIYTLNKKSLNHYANIKSQPKWLARKEVLSMQVSFGTHLMVNLHIHSMLFSEGDVAP